MKNSDNAIYTTGERYPVEVIYFKTAPEHVEDFLRVDHEVWTIKQVDMEGLDKNPYLYKEIWLNENNPGEIKVVIVWETMEYWKQVDQKEFQAKLMAEFDEKFGKPYEFLGGLKGEDNYRVSCFRRPE